MTGRFPEHTQGGGGVSDYVHDQSTPSDTWVINHNLGRRPAVVSVIDTAGTEVHGGVSHPSSTQTVLTFSAPFSGKARLL